jgi:RNA polymerase sigma-70 factor (ECF subfamily)
MSEKQDAADVDRVLSGEVDAFEGIVSRWQSPLVTLAFRFCRDRNRAEEMAQTAFIRAFQKLPKWRGEGKFGSWLLALATNAYRSEMRRHRLLMLPLDDTQEMIRSCSDTSLSVDQDRKELVRHTISALPAKYRDTVVLFYFHEKDVQETARSLRVAEGTVKARLHRGRALLRKILARHLRQEIKGNRNDR